MTSPPRSRGSRLTNNEEDNLTGVSNYQSKVREGATLILTKVDGDSVVGDALSDRSISSQHHQTNKIICSY